MESPVRTRAWWLQRLRLIDPDLATGAKLDVSETGEDWALIAVTRPYPLACANSPDHGTFTVSAYGARTLMAGQSAVIDREGRVLYPAHDSNVETRWIACTKCGQTIEQQTYLRLVYAQVP